MKHHHLSVLTGLKLHVRTDLWTLFLTNDLDCQCKVSPVKCQRFCNQRSSRPPPKGHGSAALLWQSINEAKDLARGEAMLNIWNEKDNSAVHTRAATQSLCCFLPGNDKKVESSSSPNFWFGLWCFFTYFYSKLEIKKCWLKSFAQHCICKGLINVRCLWKFCNIVLK